ncbi:MAG TPA: VWA domain-containing protein, partial [Thermoanaerobaculia bacterium]|nr:VWA domain-containing protein [Thermoanaerobaculia bacterium]
SSHGTPPAVTALRARRLLAGELDEGPAEVRAGVALDAGDAGAARRTATLEVRVEPGAEGVASPAPRRLTVAVAGEEGSATVERSTAAGAVGEDGAWVWRGPIELPAGTERVAVVAEDPSTGEWGGAVAGIFDAAREAEGRWNAAAGLLPGPKTVHLLRPDEGMLRGRVRFDAVADPRVARVDFLLDGRRQAADAAAPFSAVLGLGRLPLPRRVEVVALDAEGTELGRDLMVVNQGGRAFRVRITEPDGARAVGAVDVAAAVEVPDGRRLDRVEIFWNETLAATLFHPPFRHRLVVPPERPEGYLRAVAHLADGASTEDAVYLNGPVAAERVDVRLTELFVVVTDGSGRPVRGLEAEDFEVREDGRRQDLADFGDAADLPLTVGLAIDSSASMFVKLPAVADAALGFLDGLVPGRDRAFLVDFDDEPRLLAGPTPDLDLLRGAGEALVPGGRTSLWQAIVYSLVQLQGAPGRRALIVYSDGADQDQDFSYRTALAFARRAGVPVYVIVANEEAVRTGGLDFGFPTFGSRLEGLVAATGGRVWLVRRTDDLAAVYQAIQHELAAQYRLAYYPEGDAAGWRRLEVDVRGRGLTARTVSGYQR